MCMSVDLPEPGRPHDGGHVPARDVEGDAAKRLDRGFAVAVAAGQPSGLDDRAWRQIAGSVDE